MAARLRIREFFSGCDHRFWRRLHLVLTALWGVLAVPTVLWWHSSVLWVALISCYANAVGHASAAQAASAAEASTQDG